VAVRQHNARLQEHHRGSLYPLVDNCKVWAYYLAVRKTCARCKNRWPGDAEFFRSETAIICRACNYEARVAQKKRRKERQKGLVGAKEKEV